MRVHLSTVGPLLACFDVYEDFYHYTCGVYGHLNGGYEGGHCVAVIGYDDVQQAWICKNSWNTWWGANGYFMIGYGQCGIDNCMWEIDTPITIPWSLRPKDQKDNKDNKDSKDKDKDGKDSKDRKDNKEDDKLAPGREKEAAKRRTSTNPTSTPSAIRSHSWPCAWRRSHRAWTRCPRQSPKRPQDGPSSAPLNGLKLEPRFCRTNRTRSPSRTTGRDVVDVGDPVSCNGCRRLAPGAPVAGHPRHGSRDLSRVGWRHRPCGPAALSEGRAVVSGRVVAVHEIEIVLTRLDGIMASELTHIVSKDRDYVAAEMNAFLLSWLTRLACPVVNRPVPMGLAGANHRPEGWAALAATLGIPIRRQRRGPDGYMPPTAGITRSVILVGDKCFGDPDPELRNSTRLLAGAAGLDFMTAIYEHLPRGACPSRPPTRGPISRPRGFQRHLRTSCASAHWLGPRDPHRDFPLTQRWVSSGPDCQVSVPTRCSSTSTGP